jgi:hypothetical protein
MATVKVERYSVNELSDAAQHTARMYAVSAPYHSNSWDEQFSHYASQRLFKPAFQQMPLEISVTTRRHDDCYDFDLAIVACGNNNPISALKGLTAALISAKAEDIAAVRKLRDTTDYVLDAIQGDAVFEFSKRTNLDFSHDGHYRTYQLHTLTGAPIVPDLDHPFQDALDDFSNVIAPHLRNQFADIYKQHIDDILNVRGCIFNKRGIRVNDAAPLGNKLARAACKELIDRENSPVTLESVKALGNDCYIHEYSYMDYSRMGSLHEDRARDLWVAAKYVRGHSTFEGRPTNRDAAIVSMLKRGMSWQLE